MRFRLEFKKSSPLWWRNVLYNSSATTTYYYAGILMVMIFSSLYFSTISHSFAQHMMMPPAANIGDRKVTLNFQTEPAVIKAGQNVLMQIAFLDQSTKQA
jgi:hypothetical protein